MRTIPAGVLLVLAIVPALLLGSAGTVQAHPFGTPPVVRVSAHDRQVEATWSAQRDDVAVLKAELRKESPHGDESGYLRSHIAVRQGGRACTVAGADGTTLRFTCPEPVDRIALTVTALTDIDSSYRTLSVTDRGGGGLHTAAAPTRTLTLTPSGERGAGDDPVGGGVWTTDLASLLDRGAALPLMLLVAAAAGALHACAPGHGKTLAAGYLVGGRGRPRDAVWLGLIVAVMHTFSVATLAVGWWLASRSTPDMAAATGWLQLIAALVVGAVGVNLLRRQLGSRRRDGGDHSHSHSHDHSHGDGTDHGHGHSHHVPDAPSLLTWRGLVVLGTSGGLLPSPAAFLILLTGLLTGRVGTALVMVAAFGTGMALTLTAVGLVVLRGRDVLLARLSRSPALRVWGARVPLVAACAVVIGGAVASALAASRLMAA